ncbi:MAG: hypothetical protein BRC30_01355 [Nanohaloarchaea archaeon SW_7_46_7]|nr:MAG: hypothetical protein BRC30_01355 [Nanohaloarchaea archaeon SW_7_46_7]
MSVDIGNAIQKGLEKGFQRDSAILMGIFFAVSVVSQVMGDTLVKNLSESGNLGANQAFSQITLEQLAPLAVNLPTGVAAVGGILTGLISLTVTVGTIRMFLNEDVKLEAGYFTDNILWILANVVAGGLLFSLALTAGFIAFVIPGIFLFASLFFWSFYVIDKDMNLFEAMKTAWNDTKGNRLSTFGLLLIVFIGNAVFATVIGGTTSFIGTMAGGIAFGSVLGLLPSAVAVVFTWAIFTEGYKQLSE